MSNFNSRFFKIVVCSVSIAWSFLLSTERLSLSSIPADAFFNVLDYLPISSIELNYLIRYWGLNKNLAHQIGQALLVYLQNSRDVKIDISSISLDAAINTYFSTIFQSSPLKKDLSRYNQAAYLINTVIKDKYLAHNVPFVGSLNALEKANTYYYDDLVIHTKNIINYLDSLNPPLLIKKAKSLDRAREDYNAALGYLFLDHIKNNYLKILSAIDKNIIRIKLDLDRYNNAANPLIVRYDHILFIKRIFFPLLLLGFAEAVVFLSDQDSSPLFEGSIFRGILGITIIYVFFAQHLYADYIDNNNSIIIGNNLKCIKIKIRAIKNVFNRIKSENI